MLNRAEYIIKDNLIDIRLDKVISLLDSNITRTLGQIMIEEGDVLVNGKKEKPSYKLRLNDKIIINKKEPKDIDLKPQEMPLDIIYEDNIIIVINKSKGMVVHPGNGNPDKTLVNAVMYHAKESLSGIGGELRPGIVHRLDKDTSRINNNC